MFTKETFLVRGVAPLLMHDDKTADPTHPVTKQLKKLTSQRNKSDDVLEAIKRMEWEAGMYVDEKSRPTLPSDLIEACIIAGSKKSKMGPKFKASFFVDNVDEFKCKEPGTLEEIYQRGTAVDYRPVTVSRSKVMRARPVFKDWECKFTVQFDTEQLDPEHIVKAIQDAGQQCGFGDYRPKYGRFELIED